MTKFNLYKLFIKYIVWDFDGTLYSNPSLGQAIEIFYCHFLKRHGYPNLSSKDFHQLCQNYTSWSSAVSHLTKIPETELLNLQDIAFDKSKFLFPDPTITTFVEKTLCQYHHLIWTNSTLSEVQKCLKIIGFQPKTFEQIFSRDKTKLLKPDPIIYSIIQQHTRALKFCHLFIGDSLKQDIAPSQKCGFPAIAIWELKSFFQIK